MFVMKGMFVRKLGRKDIQPEIELLSTYVKEPNESDCFEDVRHFMDFLKDTQCYIQKMSAQTVKWYVDAAFTVHEDLKSHTGGAMTLESGVIKKTERLKVKQSECEC